MARWLCAKVQKRCQCTLTKKISALKAIQQYIDEQADTGIDKSGLTDAQLKIVEDAENELREKATNGTLSASERNGIIGQTCELVYGVEDSHEFKIKLSGLEGEYHNRDEQINAIVNLAILSGVVAGSLVTTGIFAMQIGVAVTALSGGLATVAGVVSILLGAGLTTAGISYGTYMLSGIIKAIELTSKGKAFVIEEAEMFGQYLYTVNPLD